MAKISFHDSPPRYTLQVMLSQRPADTNIADSFPDEAAREAFFKRALRLPDAAAVLQGLGGSVTTPSPTAPLGNMNCYFAILA